MNWHPRMPLGTRQMKRYPHPSFSANKISTGALVEVSVFQDESVPPTQDETVPGREMIW